jgi:hypothetical protein
MQPKITLPPCAVLSPILTAGFPAIITDEEPTINESGGPAQTQLSPTIAAGSPPISTVLFPPGNNGPPTWGFGPSDIGQVCISVALAAAPILIQIDDTSF